MPCDGGGSYDPYQDISERLKKVEAMLCAVLGSLEEQMRLDPEYNGMTVKDWLSEGDFRDAGVTWEEVDRWWEQHKREDARRREAEAKGARLKADRKAAYKKLSKEERKALGLRRRDFR